MPHVIDAATKLCTACKLELPLDSFPVAIARGKAYRRGRCLDCMRAYYRAYANPPATIDHATAAALLEEQTHV